VFYTYLPPIPPSAEILLGVKNEHPDHKGITIESSGHEKYEKLLKIRSLPDHENVLLNGNVFSTSMVVTSGRFYCVYSGDVKFKPAEAVPRHVAFVMGTDIHFNTGATPKSEACMSVPELGNIILSDEKDTTYEITITNIPDLTFTEDESHFPLYYTGFYNAPAPWEAQPIEEEISDSTQQQESADHEHDTSHVHGGNEPPAQSKQQQPVPPSTRDNRISHSNPCIPIGK
jgi:hypothetical protein